MKNPLSGMPNSVFAGLALGLAVPGLLGCFTWYLMHHFAFLAKADLLLIGCVAVNAGLLHYFFKINKENVGRGIISATFVWAFAFFFYKINQ